MFKAAAVGNLLGLASCCLPSPAISAQGQKPGQVPGEHLAFCCEEGRIRKSNAAMDWEPREGGREAGLEEAWGHNGGGSGGACPLGGRVAHPEAAAGKGAGVPALQWDLSALVQRGRADFREEG